VRKTTTGRTTVEMENSSETSHPQRRNNTGKTEEKKRSFEETKPESRSLVVRRSTLTRKRYENRKMNIKTKVFCVQ
jgi:hypothetical protein